MWDSSRFLPVKDDIMDAEDRVERHSYLPLSLILAF
jgi:hypothetical protein